MAAARARQTALPVASAAARYASTECMLLLAPRYGSGSVNSAFQDSTAQPSASDQKCCSMAALAAEDVIGTRQAGRHRAGGRQQGVGVRVVLLGGVDDLPGDVDAGNPPAVLAVGVAGVRASSPDAARAGAPATPSRWARVKT